MASRKLAGAITAIAAITAIVIACLFKDPALLVTAEIDSPLLIAIAAISALGGWQIAKQAQADAANGPPGSPGAPPMVAESDPPVFTPTKREVGP